MFDTVRLVIVGLVTTLVLAGCIQRPDLASPTSASAPDRSEDPWAFAKVPDVGPMRSFLPFTGQAGLDHLLAIGNDNPMAPPAGHVFATVVDLHNGTATDSPPSALVGGASLYKAYASAGRSGLYVALTVESGASLMGNSDNRVVVFRYADGEWSVHEDASRWTSMQVYGMAASDHRAFLLTINTATYQLWTFDGSAWRSESLPIGGLTEYRIASNGTHLFLLGLDTHGEEILRYRAEDSTAWESIRLPTPTSPFQRTDGIVTASLGQPAMVAWRDRGSSLPPNPGPAYAATLEDGSLNVTKIADNLSVNSVGVSAQNGTFAMLQSQEANSSPEVWLVDATSRKCFWMYYREFSDPMLISSRDGVSLLYESDRSESFGTRFLVRLDPTKPACLPDDRLELPHSID